MCTCVDVRVAERGQRPLDRRARGIGDPGQVRDLDVRFERRHARHRTDRVVDLLVGLPYQSSRLAPVMQLVRLAYSARVSVDHLGRHARRGRLVVPAGACP